MFTRLSFCLTAACVFFVFSSAAEAWDQYVHVTNINPGPMYMVGDASFVVKFKIDVPVATPACDPAAAEDWLYYALPAYTSYNGPTAQIQFDKAALEAKAVFSTLQLAIATGLRVHLTGSDSSTNWGDNYCGVTTLEISTQ